MMQTNILLPNKMMLVQLVISFLYSIKYFNPNRHNTNNFHSHLFHLMINKLHLYARLPQESNPFTILLMPQPIFPIPHGLHSHL